MHDFSIVDKGESALWITYQARLANVSEVSSKETYKWTGDNGFVDMDISSGRSKFEWWALDHVDTSEALVNKPEASGDPQHPWDFL